MAERITECDKCESRSFSILSTEPTNNNYIVCVKAKCNNCGNTFEYKTWSEAGKAARKRGTIR